MTSEIDDKRKRLEAEKQMGKHWTFLGYRCPKCGRHMILNHMGHECGEMLCEYIEGKETITKIANKGEVR
jgi:ribosomal protein S27E